MGERNERQGPSHRAAGSESVPLSSPERPSPARLVYCEQRVLIVRRRWRQRGEALMKMMLKSKHLVMDPGIRSPRVYSCDCHEREEDAVARAGRLHQRGLWKEGFETTQSPQCSSQFSAWRRRRDSQERGTKIVTILHTSSFQHTHEATPYTSGMNRG